MRTQRHAVVEAARRRVRVAILLVGLGLGVAPVANAQSTDLSLVSDSDTVISSIAAADHAVIATDRAAFWQAELGTMTASLPAGVAIDAMARIAANRVYLSLDADAVVGGVQFADEDVILWDGSAFSMAFDGSVEGLPASANLDAVDVVNLSPLELSFSLDVTASLVPVGIVQDDDVVRWRQGTGFLQVDFDGSARGVPAGLDLDGFSRRGASEWLISFDSAGTIGTLTFDDADILSFDPVALSFTLFFDASAQGVPAEVDFRAPVGCAVPVVLAVANGNNRIDLSWGGPLKTTTVQRSRTTGGPYTTIATVTANAYSDLTAHGSINYFYRVVHVCGTSSQTAAVSTTGSCGLPPDFGGVTSAVQTAGATCGVQVSWAAATSPCGGGVRFSVYRNPGIFGFATDASNRLASGLTGTSYIDTAGLSTTTYSYKVRATSEVNGQEDANLAQNSVTPGGCTASAPAPVPFFDVRSGDGENVLDWVNPGPGYATTHVSFRTAAGTPTCPSAGGVDAPVPGSPFTGTAGSRDRIIHTLPNDGLTRTYAACVESPGAVLSTSRVSFGRPQSVAGSQKWGYAMGAASLAIIGVIPNVSYFGVSNDRVLHATAPGTVGGMWPPVGTPTWMPYATNAPVQGRPTSVALPTTLVGTPPTASRVALLGSQDGRVYAVNAQTGALLWSTLLGTAVQAAPSALFTDFGGLHNLVLVGTRESVADSKFFGLDLIGGAIRWTFDNAGSGGIGVINSQATVDYPNRRVYFTSRRRGGGSPDTVWCLQFTDTTATKLWSRDVGDVDAAPSLRGAVLYVGNNLGEVHALDAVTGGPLWAAPYATSDGPVKGFVWPDRLSNRIYFSTTGKVHAIQDNGTTATAFWTGGAATAGAVPIAGVSAPLVVNGNLYVGSSSGRVFGLQAGTATPAAPTEAVLGDPAVPKVVGSPTFDRQTGLLLVGTDQGIAYALTPP